MAFIGDYQVEITGGKSANTQLRSDGWQGADGYLSFAAATSAREQSRRILMQVDIKRFLLRLARQFNTVCEKQSALTPSRFKKSLKNYGNRKRLACPRCH